MERILRGKPLFLQKTEINSFIIDSLCDTSEIPLFVTSRLHIIVSCPPHLRQGVLRLAMTFEVPLL